MKNDEKIDIQLEETVTEDMTALEKANEYYATAHRYLKIAQYMKKFEDHDKYFHRGIRYMKKCLPHLDVKEELRSLRFKLFRERAKGRIALYEQASTILSSAKSSVDYNAAYDLFQRIYRHEQTHSIPENFLTPALCDRLHQCSDSGEKMLYCEQQAAKKDAEAKKKSRLISGVLLLCLIAIVIFSRTSAFHQLIGSLSSLLGYNNFAAAQYESAYEKNGSEQTFQQSLSYRYQAAQDAAEEGNTHLAFKLYSSLAQDDYKDSIEKIYQLEMQQLADCEIGDSVSFGSFGNMKWHVLDKKDGKVFLLKKYALAEKPLQPFHETDAAVTWETCSLRQWLNSDYLQDKFSPQEQAAISDTLVTADDNQKYHTDGGNDTTDKLYILSSSEYEEYRSQLGKTESSLWLRTPGNAPNTASFVNRYTTIMDYGYEVSSNHISVKPIMWVNILN